MNNTKPPLSLKDLSLAANSFGPVPEEAKLRLIGYAANPTPAGWRDIRGILLSRSSPETPGGMTVWQACAELFDWMPVKGFSYGIGQEEPDWPRIPTGEEIRQAVIFATH